MCNPSHERTTPTAVPRLPAAATVALIAPAGPGELDIGKATRWMASRGLTLNVYPGVLQRQGYLAGSDQTRLRDLHDAFADPQVDAILCLRGGYGSPRLLDRIDYDLLARHPKPFVGYSDLTALHLAINQRAGFVTFHGPLLNADLLQEKRPPTEAALWNMLRGQVGTGQVIAHPVAHPLRTVEHGISHGRLTGGNLAIIGALMSTPWEIETQGAILFIEDINEPLYRIDRLLNQLRLAGKFEGLLGVVAGDFAGIDNEPLDALLHQYFRVLGIPVLSGWRSGHCDPNLTLPMGALVRLDAEARTLTLEQNVTL
jgi:muramoyltetrapeptide carboxypeptidase